MEIREERIYEVFDPIGYHMKEAMRQAEEFLKSQGVTEENAHEWEKQFTCESNLGTDRNTGAYTITLTVNRKTRVFKAG
jgi:hypothetical protein